MQRRRFIAACVGAGLIASTSVYYYNDGRKISVRDAGEDAEHSAPFDFLSDDDALILSALVPIFVGNTFRDVGVDDSSVSHDTPLLDNSLLLNEAQIHKVIENIDDLMTTLPQRSRDEVRELLDLLGNDVSRILAAGVWDDWERASEADRAAFLRSWRDSWLGIFQKAYHGLHQIILGSYYAERASWSILHYPGPPSFSR